MTESKRYLTIAEFARASGLSRQTVYNRLDKDLTQFVKVDNRRRLIDIKALDFLSVNQRVKESVKVDKDLTQEYIQSLKDTIQDLREQNQNLTQLLSQQQALSLDLQQKVNLLEEPPEPDEQKKGIFSRFFSDK